MFAWFVLVRGRYLVIHRTMVCVTRGVYFIIANLEPLPGPTTGTGVVIRAAPRIERGRPGCEPRRSA